MWRAKAFFLGGDFVVLASQVFWGYPLARRLCDGTFQLIAFFSFFHAGAVVYEH
jgi:hypothetical protein